MKRILFLSFIFIRLFLQNSNNKKRTSDKLALAIMHILIIARMAKANDKQ